MTIHTCQFVNASDLFMALDDLWKQVQQAERIYPWDGRSRTLIDPRSLLRHLDKHPVKNTLQVEMLRHRVAMLPDGVYVDFEN